MVTPPRSLYIYIYFFSLKTINGCMLDFSSSHRGLGDFKKSKVRLFRWLNIKKDSRTINWKSLVHELLSIEGILPSVIMLTISILPGKRYIVEHSNRPN